MFLKQTNTLLYNTSYVRHVVYPPEIYSIYICLPISIQSNYLIRVYIVKTYINPFGQIIIHDVYITVATVFKTFYSLKLLVAFFSHNCEDVFRKDLQNRIAKDWQTMCHINL
jgi:hypothetical protein